MSDSDVQCYTMRTRQLFRMSCYMMPLTTTVTHSLTEQCTEPGTTVPDTPGSVQTVCWATPLPSLAAGPPPAPAAPRTDRQPGRSLQPAPPHTSPPLAMHPAHATQPVAPQPDTLFFYTMHHMKQGAQGGKTSRSSGGVDTRAHHAPRRREAPSQGRAARPARPPATRRRCRARRRARLEDGRVRVRVDGHDALGVLHAGQVLDRARDAHRDVQLRRHHLAGLADLRAPGCRPP